MFRNVFKRFTFRISSIVVFSLIFGITAKPYEPWNKLPDEAVQETVVSIDEKGRVSWGVEVEPPEDTDKTDYDIDPWMKIWKSMAGNADKAEEDSDELYHPSMADLLKARILEGLRDADMQSDGWKEVVKYDQKPEEDRDDIDHPVFYKVASEEPEQDWDDVYHKAKEELDVYLAPLVSEYKADAEVQPVHSEPEKDDDDLYHPDLQELVHIMEPREVVGEESQDRVHLQPEEDMDEVYHADLIIPYQRDSRAAYPVEWPSQRQYTEPETDMDDFYHN
ncbi:uncharacterized protein LOC115434598 [Sphaeramia orbicularis]|uniref:uncharacterized protein LOC115434598 n=1 Tax=Sphaeramia orbicularis TaxID=375764 RepID=UPI00117F818C|nr:uncharacterized protein LOC115434598 [Sphaeramia orbicularis]